MLTSPLVESLGEVSDAELSALIYEQYLWNDFFHGDDERAWQESQKLASASVDITLGSSWLEVTPSVDAHSTQQAFLHGGCGYIAGELHRVTGLPLVRFTSPDDRFGWRGHWAVQVGDDSYLDIRGVVSEGELLGELAGAHAWSVERGSHLYGSLVAEVRPDAISILDDLDELEAALIRRYVGQIMAGV